MLELIQISSSTFAKHEKTNYKHRICLLAIDFSVNGIAIGAFHSSPNRFFIRKKVRSSLRNKQNCNFAPAPSTRPLF